MSHCVEVSVNFKCLMYMHQIFANLKSFYENVMLVKFVSLLWILCNTVKVELLSVADNEDLGNLSATNIYLFLLVDD